MIDKNRLINVLKEYIDFSLWDEIDFDDLVNKSVVDEDDSLIIINNDYFTFLFDLLNYDLIDAIGEVEKP